jgi:hypothetical protein
VQPLYHRIAEDMIERIKGGELKPGDYAQQLCGFYCSNKRNSEMGFWGGNCSADRYADQHAVVKKRTEEKGDHKNGRMRSSRCDVFTQTFNRG